MEVERGGSRSKVALGMWTWRAGRRGDAGGALLEDTLSVFCRYWSCGALGTARGQCQVNTGPVATRVTAHGAL